MSLKKLGAALFATLAIGAVMASSAFAAPSTGESHWRVAGNTLSGSANVKCHIGGENFHLAGEAAGAPLELEATGVNCVGESKITQESVSEVPMAVDSGTLEFTGVKVVTPAGCAVSESTITTKPLVTKIQEEGTGAAGEVYDLFEPAPGQTRFATINIVGCSAQGAYKVTGSVYGRAKYATGVEEREQPLKFDAGTDAISSLSLGGNPATFHGEAVNELVSEAKFGATK